MSDRQVRRTHDAQGDLDSAVAGSGERGRPPTNAVEHLEGPTFARPLLTERPSRGLCCGKAVKDHAHWWYSELKSQVEASRSSAVGGLEVAIPARVADVCNRVFGQESSKEGEAARAGLVRTETGRDLDA